MIPEGLQAYVEQQQLLLNVTRQIASSAGLNEIIPHILEGVERAIRPVTVRLLLAATGGRWRAFNGISQSGEMAPVDWAVRQNADGGASILFGEIEKVSRMRWSVALTLSPGCAFFESEMRLSNRTPLPNRFWFWANSSAPVSAGMRYVSTSSKVSDLFKILDFPVHDGVDISWDRNHPEPQDMFGLNHRDDWGAWYNDDTGRGMVNVADRTESRGLKFFTWGNSDDGNIWQARLTETDGPYAEMQSGRFPTQRVWEIMSPFSEESWKEAWYPITGIGAPFYANREAAFSIREGGAQGSLKLGVQSTRAHKAARIVLEAGSSVLWEKRADLSPGSPLIEEIRQKKAPGEEAATISVRDTEGRLLARALLPGRPAPDIPIRSVVHVEARENAVTAEELCQAGRDREKLGEFPAARGCYMKALMREPGCGAALTALGILDLRQGMTGDALKRFRAVLQKDPSEEHARFFLAAGLLAAERYADAAEELKQLVRSRAYRAGSSFLLGGILLGQGELSKAEERLGKCVREFPWLDDAAALLACCLRKQGRRQEAQAALKEVLAGDPLHFLSLAESCFLAAEAGEEAERARARVELGKACRGESQAYLEIASDYARVGLFGEAFEVLSLHAASPGGGRAPDPLVNYHLGYYAEKAGRQDYAAHYRRGSEADARWVFPHRTESEKVMLRGLELDPRDGRLLYYLGTLLCAKDRPEEAIRLWEAAVPVQRSNSVLRRNLGRAYWKVRRDPDKAIGEYREAIRSAPKDYKLYLELDKILVSCGQHGERRKLLAGMPAELLQNDLIAERVAAMHADAGEFEPALAILGKVFFFPWEVYKGVRLLFVDCCVGQGLKLAAAGKHAEAAECFRAATGYPRNIGVGEPFRTANAEAWLRVGTAQHAAGNAQAARESWTRAAEEPRPAVDALCYYRARALQNLGRGAEAAEGLRLLLGAEDPYLAGLAAKGLGDRVKAQLSFEAALAANPAHRRARWELEGFTGQD